MPAISPGNPHHEGLGDERSRHVKAADLPWEKTRFPGCEVKTLLVDPSTGLATVLVKMAPGAELPDHEHAMIEQTYVLEGALVDKDGPDAGPVGRAGRIRLAPAGLAPRRLGAGRLRLHRHVSGAEQVLRKERRSHRHDGPRLGAKLVAHGHQVAPCFRCVASIPGCAIRHARCASGSVSGAGSRR